MLALPPPSKAPFSLFSPPQSPHHIRPQAILSRKPQLFDPHFKLSSPPLPQTSSPLAPPFALRPFFLTARLPAPRLPGFFSESVPPTLISAPRLLLPSVPLGTLNPRWVAGRLRSSHCFFLKEFLKISRLLPPLPNGFDNSNGPANPVAGSVDVERGANVLRHVWSFSSPTRFFFCPFRR